MFKDLNQDIAQQAAEALGMQIDPDGFLLHGVEDEELAQALFNREYNRLLHREGYNGRMPRFM